MEDAGPLRLYCTAAAWQLHCRGHGAWLYRQTAGDEAVVAASQQPAPPHTPTNKARPGSLAHTHLGMRYLARPGCSGLGNFLNVLEHGLPQQPHPWPQPRCQEQEPGRASHVVESQRCNYLYSCNGADYPGLWVKAVKP
eukprot:3123300-Prymnesium_polylepis.1